MSPSDNTIVHLTFQFTVSLRVTNDEKIGIILALKIDKTFKTLMNKIFLLVGTVALSFGLAFADSSTDISTRTFVLKYAKATEVADSLNKLCEKLQVKEAAVAFPESHSVAVAGPQSVVEACAKIVSDIDRKPKQVYVEARFLDVLAADVQKLGITWTLLNGLEVSGNVAAGVGGAKLPNGSSWNQNANSGLSMSDIGGRNNGSYYQGTLSASQLSLVLSALSVNNDSRMFANPRVVVASGKTATVDISTKRPNVIITAKRTVDGNNNSLDIDAKLQEIPGKDKLMFAGESFYWWGIGLRVEPYVAEDGIITARIVPNVSDLSDGTQQSEGAYVMATTGSADMPASKFPIIDVKRIETEFSLKSGETAVIGGLSKTEFEEIETGIPYLWRIPVIGPYLFGSTQKVRRQREIVVLVTMGLVDPETPDKAAGLPKNAFISREYVNGKNKEPGDYTREELIEMYRQNEKPNAISKE